MCTEVRYKGRGRGWEGFFPHAGKTWHGITFDSLKIMGLPKTAVKRARETGDVLRRVDFPGERVSDVTEDLARGVNPGDSPHDLMARAQSGKRTCAWDATCNVVACVDPAEATRLVALAKNSRGAFESIPLNAISSVLHGADPKTSHKALLEAKSGVVDVRKVNKAGSGKKKKEQKDPDALLAFVLDAANADKMLLVQPMGADGDASHVIGVFRGEVLDNAAVAPMKLGEASLAAACSGSRCVGVACVRILVPRGAGLKRKGGEREGGAVKRHAV